jgi:hypothetical protein
MDSKEAAQAHPEVALYSQTSPTNPLATVAPRRDPLAIPGIVRIPLEPGQAAMLAGLGELFIAISPASYPSQPGLALLVLPTSKELATDACRVALGECRATRIRPVKP